MLRRINIIAVLFMFAALWGCQDEGNMLSFNGNDDPQSSEQRFGRQATKAAFEGTFEVTIVSLAPATGPGASQPLSPPIAATHKPGFHMFRPGEPASDELRQIAEDAVGGPMVELLHQSEKVHDVAQGDQVIFPEHSYTFTIKATGIAHRLSFATMLVNTNDAFTGFDGFPLPREGERMVYLRALDAGTEKNTELKAHIPGPCCGNPLVRVPTEEPISLHPGIQGVGDLDPDTYGWDEPVAKLIVKRIE